MADPNGPKRPPIDLGLFRREDDEAAVQCDAALRPKHADQATELVGRAGIAARPQHLVEPGGAQPRILRQRVANEGQIRVQDRAPTRAPADDARVERDRRAHGVRVHAELRDDGTDLPMLAEIEAANLGVLLGRDHQEPPAARPPTASAPARSTRSPAGRRHSAAWDREQAAQHSESGARRRPAVWRHPGGPGKCDPARGGGRDTRADGRGGRVALPASRDAAPSRHARSVGAPRPGSTASSRRDRGHRPSKSQTARRRCGTPSGATGRRPWRRLSSDDGPWTYTAISWHN